LIAFHDAINVNEIPTVSIVGTNRSEVTSESERNFFAPISAS
jgi:hypothetical protein